MGTPRLPARADAVRLTSVNNSLSHCPALHVRDQGNAAEERKDAPPNARLLSNLPATEPTTRAATKSRLAFSQRAEGPQIGKRTPSSNRFSNCWYGCCEIAGAFGLSNRNIVHCRYCVKTPTRCDRTLDVQYCVAISGQNSSASVGLKTYVLVEGTVVVCIQQGGGQQSPYI